MILVNELQEKFLERKRSVNDCTVDSRKGKRKGDFFIFFFSSFDFAEKMLLLFF